jgi:hypothetical protein
MAETATKKSPKFDCEADKKKKKKKSPFYCFTANRFYVVNLKK